MKFLVPDASGHSVTEFDKANPEDMERAEKMFIELVKGAKKVAYARDGEGSPSRVIRKLDPNADETVFFSPLAGG
jgi:hypothetical protein